MKPVLSLSTCWCSHRHNDGYVMLKEIADLGFESIEFSHGIRITLVPGALRAVEEGIVKVGSTHNFCPLPTGVVQAAPNLFEPSCREFREHDQWLRHTKRSIDFAAQVKARAIVCHLGSVKFFWFNPAHNVRTRMGPYWAQVKASIAEVLDHAREKGVRLGFENREKFDELPVDADYAEFLAGFEADAPVGYWHDTGHADIKEGMGLLNHRQHLAKMAPRQIGWHLHDVDANGQDHQPIGSGHIDFKMVSEFWRPEHNFVLELGPRASVDDVLESKRRIEALMAAR
jgi:sugar phosphate isomerase/epimerase